MEAGYPLNGSAAGKPGFTAQFIRHGRIHNQGRDSQFFSHIIGNLIADRTWMRAIETAFHILEHLFSDLIDPPFHGPHITSTRHQGIQRIQFDIGFLKHF